jgi:hypothetical protein
MAGVLEDAGHKDEALLIRSAQDTLKSGGKLDNSAVDTMRMSSEISTVAAAATMSIKADRIGIDPSKPENGGLVYAAYNVGEGNAKKLMNGNAISGFEVSVNSVRNAGSTAAAQIAHFDRVVADGVGSARGRTILAAVENSEIKVPNPTTPSYGPEHMVHTVQADEAFDPFDLRRIHSTDLSSGDFGAPASGRSPTSSKPDFEKVAYGVPELLKAADVTQPRMAAAHAPSV